MMSQIAHTNILSAVDKIPTVEVKKQPRRRSIIREFCLNTSTHALPGIARSESIHNRAFWLVSFISFSGIMIYFIVTAIIAYFQYPTSIDISYVRERPQYFPAFSLCNGSPLVYEHIIGPLLNFSNATTSTSTNNTAMFNESQVNDLWELLIYKTNKNDLSELYFFSLSSMLRVCIYNFQSCSANDFIPFLSSYYGLCYTFNAKLQNNTYESVRYTNQNGGDGKLYLGLYIYSHQYVPYTTKCKLENKCPVDNVFYWIFV